MMESCIKGCKICGGYGWLRQDIEDIYDPAFGKLVPCPNSVYKHWDAALNISREEAFQLDWDKFIQTEAVQAMRKAYETVLERGFGMVYIYGEVGNGKTIMGKAFSIYSSMQRQFSTCYIKFSELVNNLRSSYDQSNGQELYARKLSYYSEVPVLVLDEIGRDRDTKFSGQSLCDLLDNRYVKATAKKGITVWISNFKPEEIFEPYQVDRIRDGRFEVLEVKGASLRPAMEYPAEDEKGIPWWIK